MGQFAHLGGKIPTKTFGWGKRPSQFCVGSNVCSVVVCDIGSLCTLQPSIVSKRTPGEGLLTRSLFAARTATPLQWLTRWVNLPN